MEKLSVAFVLLALCATHVHCWGNHLNNPTPRTYHQTTSGSIRGNTLDVTSGTPSLSSSKATASSANGGAAGAAAGASVQGGTARAVAAAVSETFSAARPTVVKFCGHAYSAVRRLPTRSPSFCVDVWAELDEVIHAVGEVTAEAIALTFVESDVVGNGKACASAQAAGKVTAESYAKILAYAVAHAHNGYTTVTATAAIQQYIHVFVEAFANAYSNACAASDSTAVAIATTQARVAARACATLVIWLMADIDCTGYGGFSKVSFLAHNGITQETESSSDTVALTDNNADASSGGDSGAGVTTPPLGYRPVKPVRPIWVAPPAARPRCSSWSCRHGW